MNTTTLVAILTSEIEEYENSSQVSRLVNFDNGKDQITQFYINAYGKAGIALKEMDSDSQIQAIGQLHFIKDTDEEGNPYTYPQFEARTVSLATGMSCMAYTHVDGNLGSDPEVRMNGESPIANVSIYSRKDKDHSDIFRCSFFDRNANNAASFMRKGEKVAVSGRLNFNINNEVVYWQITADNFELLGSRPQEGGVSAKKPPAPKAKSVTPKPEPEKELVSASNGKASDSDQIPF